ncbi:MAG: cold shock domain-containing protein [Thermosynechococcaceae cyanobacterium]
MIFMQNKGRLTSWKDNRGFGFIKPDNGGKDVFLHISVLQQAGRRPKVGDVILYEHVTESNGKVRAARASIQGVAPQSLGMKRKPKRRGLLKSLAGVGFLATMAIFRMEFGPSSFPSPSRAIIQPGCTIKGNISHDTGNKMYHLQGMEDYKSTVIDPGKGERWFCDEADAIAKGWKKAPR